MDFRKLALGLIAMTIALGMATSISLAGSAREHSESVVPIWTRDLDVDGYKHVEIRKPIGSNPFDEQAGIFFLDDQTLVAHFGLPEEPPALSLRGVGGQVKLRAVSVAGRDGLFRWMRDWPATKTKTSILPIKGGFAVFGQDTLQIYSNEGKLITGLQLPKREEYYVDDFLRVSPSGTVLWLVRNIIGNGRKWSFVERLNPQDLAQMSTWEMDYAGADFSVSDNAIARAYPQIRTSVVVSQNEEPWRTILKAKDLGSKGGWCIGDPVFVNNSELIAAGCSHVVLLNVNGEVLMDDQYGKEWHIENGSVTPSRNGKFVALSVMKTKGGAFDTSVRRSETKIVVYDLLRKSRMLEVEVLPLPHFVYRFALSPDGSLLAIMIDSTVKVYRVPSLQADTSSQ